MDTPHKKPVSTALVMAFYTYLVIFPKAGEASLPTGLSSPDQRVVCNASHGICYDRFGASIGLTQIFLGREVAESLTARLRDAPTASDQGVSFSPAPGIECTHETGPCRTQDVVLKELTLILFGPWQETGLDANTRMLVNVDWKWLGSHYSNDSLVKPTDSARYTLRFAADGSVNARVDCNRAGGQYRLEEGKLSVEITHSTMAACEPDSLEAVFLKDMGRTDTFMLQDGKLHIDLKHDTGAMEFGR